MNDKPNPKFVYKRQHASSDLYNQPAISHTEFPNPSVHRKFPNHGVSKFRGPNISNENGSERAFGNEQFINFGKHKGKTFYDVANDGDFSYLSWLKRPGGIKLRPSCYPHLNASLQLKKARMDANDQTLIWARQVSERDENGKSIVYFEYKTKNEQIKSPSIFLQLCKLCNVSRSKECFNRAPDICDKCCVVVSSEDPNFGNLS